jgi:biotin/methionine sulfoxide reductase
MKIAELARRAAETRTLVTCTFSLQRAKHGEQPVWMAVVLAALLGQIGLPGGGFGHGYACFGNIGSQQLPVPPPGLPRVPNPVNKYIPVARVADMLLSPGEQFDYDGRVLSYPRIDLVYWCGGNPFHHHQDLGRLRRALARPGTVVVHDPFWTGMAKHADIVLPSTTTLERNDIFASHSDPRLAAMQGVVPPIADARNDYDTFCDLSDALGFGPEFSEGRSEMEWLAELYEQCRTAWRERGHELPPFEQFWEVGEVGLPVPDEGLVQFEDFRQDPVTNPLATPSGRIEIFSETIASFGYDDCPGHPAWLESDVTSSRSSDVAGELVLVANNPATRLHSQLDGGKASQASKIRGREPVRISRSDAADRGIDTGDVVRIHNARGSCLAGAVISDDVRPGVLQLSTGSWFDPADDGHGPPFCVHGNPNVLTADEGTSRLAQGCTGQLALVQLERFEGELPAIRAFNPPPLDSPT